MILFSAFALLSLLHVRGGVSVPADRKKHFFGSSPRPWRCFHQNVILVDNARVFSTSVEVFPAQASVKYSTAGLLHVRGGVSRFESQSRDS